MPLSAVIDYVTIVAGLFPHDADFDRPIYSNGQFLVVAVSERLRQNINVFLPVVDGVVRYVVSHCMSIKNALASLPRYVEQRPHYHGRLLEGLRYFQWRR